MSGSGSKLVGIKKHDIYYIKGGDVYFLVDERMFRVHRYFFERESSYFQQMFRYPALPGQEPEGTSHSTAFKLNDLTVENFANFLWVFYNPKHSLYDASTDVWTQILHTACKWAFPEVKALAIRELERKTLGLVDRIVLYQNNNIDPSVLAPLYAKLCVRDEPLTTEESLRLTVETAVHIFHARERLHSISLDGLRSPLPSGMDLSIVMKIIDEVWGSYAKRASGSNGNTQQGSSSTSKANGSTNGKYAA